MKLTAILKLPVTDDILERMGFTDYDDEHCTWGNRRLFVGGSLLKSEPWYKLQIIEYGDYPNDNGPEYNDCFYYAGWFELITAFRTNDGWRLDTVKDIYKIVYLYHREYLKEFKEILNKLK